jgi:phosphopantothenoylcysteine synthetase/decarboxylase
MDMQVIDKMIELLGKESSLKIACGVTRPGPIDIELDKSKIERARLFEFLKPDSLELTDLGKIFVVKTMLDYADQLTDGEEDDEDNQNGDEDKDWDEDEDYEDWDEEDDEDWDEDEDEDFDDWEEWDEEDEDDEDEYGPKRRGRRR